MGHDLPGAMPWALVMNASRVRVLRGLAEDAPPELVATSAARHLREHLRGTPADPAEAIGADLTEFVRETLGCLAILQRAGDFDCLALVAPSAVMARTDAEMPRQLGRGVRWRQVADLVPLPDPVLRAALLRLVETGPSP